MPSLICSPSACFRRHRTGSTFVAIVIFLVAAAGIGASVWYLSSTGEDAFEEPMLAKVERGPYELVVIEQGEVESSNNVEIRCEVKSRGTSGTSILEVAAEGAQVNEGDLLVKLDASVLERELDTQQIAVNTSYGMMVQAGNTLEASNVAREEYLQGAYKQEEQLVLSEIFVAEENLKRAQLSVESGERLAAKGLVTTLQLDGDRFAVEKARNELDSAKTKVKVLRELTRKKMLIQFDSDIKTAEVKFENEKKNHEVERKKLQDIEVQIARCTILAPQAGQVVYANIVSSRGGSAEFVVEAGALVRESQVIIRLPDPRQMQVKAKINESRITQVRPEMPASIRIDAFGEDTLEGWVTKVNQYAEPSGWSGSQAKEYATIINIVDPPAGIRPGLTAEVRIHIEKRQDALQIPVQALYEFKNHMFCLVKKDGRWETREVVFDSSNDKTVVLKPGSLDEGEQVVLNPRKHSHRLQLPDLPDPSTVEDRLAAKETSKILKRGEPNAKGNHTVEPAKKPESKQKKALAKDENRDSTSTGTSE